MLHLYRKMSDTNGKNFAWHNQHDHRFFQPEEMMLLGNQHHVHQHSYDEQQEWWYDLLRESIEQIPIHEKTGYMTALVKCPLEVRMREANPAVFIEFEDANMWAAARRLVNYWEWRVLLFGEIVAYESILDVPYNSNDRTITTIETTSYSTEAARLRAELRQLIDDQSMIVLPETDSEGKFFILYQPERCSLELPQRESSQSNDYNVLRVLLYCCTVIISKTSTWTRQYHNSTSFNNATCLKARYGFISVYTKLPNNSENVGPNFVDILENAFPAHVECAHLLFVPKDSSKAWKMIIRSIANLVYPIVATLLNKTLILPRVLDKKSDVMQHLLPYGITRDMLPKPLGGNWHYPRKAKENCFDTKCLPNEVPEQSYKHHFFHTREGDTILANALEQIPWQDKKEYLSSFQHCPLEIRNAEANPLAFIEYEGGDVAPAANRLVKYWSWRVLLFGEPMAYQSILSPTPINSNSMDHGTAGIVNSSTCSRHVWNDFCKLIDHHVVTILPNFDVDGNFVLVYDRSRLPSECNNNNNNRENSNNEIDEQMLLRLFMCYLTRILSLYRTNTSKHGNTTTSNNNSNHYDSDGSNNPKSASVVVLNVVKTFPQSSYNLSSNVCEMLLTAFPTKLVRIHSLVLTNQNDTSQFRWIRNAVSEVSVRSKPLLGTNVVCIPIIGTLLEMGQQLEFYGFSRDMLPQSLGGEWQYPSIGQETVSTQQEEHILEHKTTGTPNQTLLQSRSVVADYVTTSFQQKQQQQQQQPQQQQQQQFDVARTTSVIGSPQETVNSTDGNNHHVGTAVITSNSSGSATTKSKFWQPVNLAEYWRQYIPPEGLGRKQRKSLNPDNSTTIKTKQQTDKMSRPTKKSKSR